MLNRRRFFLATAAGVAGRSLSAQIPGASLTVTSQHPLMEVNLSDPRVTDAQIQNAHDVFVNLFELRPADPGQLSGCELRVHQHGLDLFLSVNIGTHCLGLLGYDDLTRWLDKAEERGDLETAASLLENFSGYPGPWNCNGGFLILTPGAEPELEVRFREHCFGILRGELAARFLACVRQRLAVA